LRQHVLEQTAAHAMAIVARQPPHCTIPPSTPLSELHCLNPAHGTPLSSTVTKPEHGEMLESMPACCSWIVCQSVCMHSTICGHGHESIHTRRRATAV
jgi:hypothetical protein